MTTNIRFEDWEAEQMRDPEFRAAAEELEPAYQVARMRMLRGLTQAELAKLVGTRQPGIARLESGKTEPRLSFLRRVAQALRARLVIQLVPEEETPLLPEPDRSYIDQVAAFLDPGARANTFAPYVLSHLAAAEPECTADFPLLSQTIEDRFWVSDQSSYQASEGLLVSNWPKPEKHDNRIQEPC